MARISYRRAGQDCARVERGDRGVCADIGGAQRGVSSAQFSPDGTNIVSAVGPDCARVERGDRECADIGGAQRRVNSAQFSPDGTNIVSASGTRLCEFWMGSKADRRLSAQMTAPYPCT